MSDFQWLFPLRLWLIVPLALFLLWYRLPHRNGSLIAPHLRLEENDQPRRSPLLWIGASLLIAILALAGPSWQKQTVPTAHLAQARVIVMDMRPDMYATDVKPSRLMQAKFKINDLLKKWQDGSSGLVTYAHQAYVISPLTTDSNTILHLVTDLSPNIMPYFSGISDAKTLAKHIKKFPYHADLGVKQAIDLLKNAGKAKGDIILVTSGVDAEEADQIRSLIDNSPWHLSIYLIARGDGAPIALPNGSLLKNDQGATFMSKPDLSLLKQLTQLNKGQLVQYRVDDRDIQALSTAPKEEYQTSQQNPKIENRINNGFWLLPLLCLAVLPLFRQGIIFSLALVLLFSAPSQPSYAGIWQNDNQQAYQAFQDKNYQQAAKQFDDKKWRAAAQYQAGNYQQTIKTLADSKDEASRYNLANAYAQSGQYQQAIDIYQQILSHNPDHKNAQHNLEIVQQAKKEQEKQKENQQQQQNKDQKQKKDQDKQDQKKQNDDNQGKDKDKENSPSDQSDKPSDQQQNKSQDQKRDQQDNQQSDPTQQPPADQKQNPSKEAPQHQPQKADQPTDDANKQKEQQAVANQQGQQDKDGKKQLAPQLKRLDQVPNNAKKLIEAQMLQQARERYNQ